MSHQKEQRTRRPARPANQHGGSGSANLTRALKPSGPAAALKTLNPKAETRSLASREPATIRGRGTHLLFLPGGGQV